MVITIGDVCQILGVCRPTVREQAAKWGLSVHLTPGGHRRYLLSEVRALAEKRRDEAAARLMAHEGRLHGVR